MSEVKSNAAADKALSEMWAQQLISQRRASEALPILRKHFNDATAELRRDLEEVKRQLWGAERRVVNLERERDELKDLRSEETSLELAATVIKWMSSVDPMTALPFGTKEYSLASIIHAALNTQATPCTPSSQDPN